MNPDAASDLIEIERERNPQVVILARQLSIAVRIEVELLRAMRLSTMPWADAGVEADLYFSPLVMARDSSAIVFIPEVRQKLNYELSLHRNELDDAKRVVEGAHREMDSVILLEELTTVDALRGDRDAYQSMQSRLGTLVRELQHPEVDPDLLNWTAGALDRLPMRARSSEAGRELGRIVGRSLGTGDETAQRSGSADRVKLGFRAYADGIALRQSPPPGWTETEVAGPLPITIEVGWPVPGGWETQSVDISKAESAVRLAGVPFGLVRLRSMNGNEVRLRIDGPFKNLRPKILRPGYGTHRPGDAVISTVTEDMDWQLESEWLPTPGANGVFITHLGAANSELEAQLAMRIRDSGLEVLSGMSLNIGDNWRDELSRHLSIANTAVIIVAPGAVSETARHEVNSLLMRQRQSGSLNLYVFLQENTSLEESSIANDPELFEELRARQITRDPDELIKTISETAYQSAAEVSEFDAFVLSFAGRHSLSDYIETLKASSPGSPELPSRLGSIVNSGKPIVVRVDDHFQSATMDVQVTGPTRQKEFMDLLDRLSHELVDQQRPGGKGSSEALRREMLRGEQLAIASWLKQAPERQRVPSEPPHAMVMMQWKRWWPPGTPAPRQFHQYQSRQVRLLNLIGDGGTLWVVTGQATKDGSRRYQLAYQLRNVKGEIRSQKSGDLFEVSADWGDVRQFPRHDATELLRGLEFTTGKAMIIAADIGRRLQSIPHLTEDDVQQLEAFASQLEEVPIERSDTVDERTESTSRVMIFYSGERADLSDQVVERLRENGIELADAVLWSDPDLRDAEDTVGSAPAIHCHRSARKVADRIRDVLSELVPLDVKQYDETPEVFSVWTNEPDVDNIQIMLTRQYVPAEQSTEPADANFDETADKTLERLSQLESDLASSPVLSNRRLTDGLHGLLEAQKTAVGVLHGARYELLSEKGSFDAEEVDTVLEDLAALAYRMGELINKLRVEDELPIVSRTRTRDEIVRHLQFYTRGLGQTNKPLRMLVDRAMDAFQSAVNELSWISRIPFICAHETLSIAEILSNAVQREVGPWTTAGVDLLAIEDEKSMVGAVADSDVFVVFATEPLLQQMARDDRWLAMLDKRAKDNDAFVLTIGYGIRERWDSLSTEIREGQAFINLDENLMFSDASGTESEQAAEDVVLWEGRQVSLEYLREVLDEPVNQLRDLLFDVDSVLERVGQVGMMSSS